MLAKAIASKKEDAKALSESSAVEETKTTGYTTEQVNEMIAEAVAKAVAEATKATAKTTKPKANEPADDVLESLVLNKLKNGERRSK